MHERDLEPEHPLARLAVDQLCASRSEVGCGRSHVVDFVRDVMHARPVLREKLADRRVVAESRQELDPVVTDADRRRFDALGIDADPMLQSTAKETLVCAHRLVEIHNSDPDVMDSPCFHGVDAIGRRLGRRLGRFCRNDLRHADRVGGAGFGLDIYE
jgi:hypothetical protein